MNSKPCLTLEDCHSINAACEAEAKKNNWIVTIAILDDGGHTLLLTRMDGASPVTAEIAEQKGRSAAISRRSTKVARTASPPGASRCLACRRCRCRAACRSWYKANASAASASREFNRTRTSRCAMRGWRY